MKTLEDLRDLGDLQFSEICWNWNCRRFTWQGFEEFPEPYLAPSRGTIWRYPAVGTIHGASGVCMRRMRRYGSVWLVVSGRSFLSWAYVVYHCRTIRLYVMTAWW